MKFMKLGTRPDTFYTEEAVRTVISDVPSDLTVRINTVTYLLHKCFLLPKCGLLHRLVPDKEQPSGNVTLDLHDIPGGEEAFELCAKFCYGITINLSAHNFAPVFCAARFLRMTESIEPGNMIPKLESFFASCILEGWKDSVVALQNAEKAYEWSEKIGIVRRCIESIVDKILTPPAKITWSYTYTRPGHDKRRHPKDWWTEDVSFLDIDIFKCIISMIKSSNMLQPQLIGEALHVYAFRWLLDSSDSGSASVLGIDSRKRIFETIVTLIPTQKGSVSVKFLLRLLGIGNGFGASSGTKAELVRLSGLQLDEATTNDLVVVNDIDLVKMVLESFWRQWRRQGAPAGESHAVRSLHKVGKLIDTYLQVVAKDHGVPAHKLAAIIDTLPGIARPDHNDLYKAINSYLKEHPDLDKAVKKQICRSLDFQKLSPEVRAHAVRNEHLPLRTVVQVLFFDQENPKTNTTTTTTTSSKKDTTSSELQPPPPPLSSAETSRARRKPSKGGSKPELISESSFKIRETDKAKETS